MSSSIATTPPTVPTVAAAAFAAATGQPANADQGLGPAVAATPEAPHAPAIATHGVLIVHGIGNQRQSDILLDIGEPLHDWLQRWFDARQAKGTAPPKRRWYRRLRRSWAHPIRALCLFLRFGGVRQHPRSAGLPRLQSVVLDFDSVDRGETDAPSFAILDLPRNHGRWVLGEAWWAASLRRQSFAEMLLWTGRHLIEAARSLVLSAWERLIGDSHDRAQLPTGMRIGLAFYYQVMLILFFFALLLGLPLILVLFAAALLPIPSLRKALYGLVGPFLEVNLGEFRTIFEDEIQSANMRRRVAEAVSTLVEKHQCREVTIVAHSGGAVVCFDMLTDPVYSTVAASVRKLITVGSGLNKAWLIAPDLQRLHGPLPARIHWVDIWGTFDPAPSGSLQPPPHPHHPDQNIPVFQPGLAVIAQQHLTPRHAASDVAQAHTRRQSKKEYWPESVRCTNELSVIADHWVYWRNDEETMARIVAEIDQPYYRDSPFWRGDTAPANGDAPYLDATNEGPQRDGVYRRRMRVVWLAAARMVAIAIWLGSAGVLAQPLACWLYDRRGPLLPLPGSLVSLLATLDDWSRGRFERLAPFGRWLVGWIDPLPDRSFVLVENWLGQPCFTITFRLLGDRRLPFAAVLLGIGWLLIGIGWAIYKVMQRLPERSFARRLWEWSAPWSFAWASVVAFAGPGLALFLPLLAPHPIFWVLAALLIGLPVLGLFNYFHNRWLRWDQRARNAFIASLATNRG